MRHFAVTLVLILAFGATSLFAQVDDFGALDSILISQVTTSPGSSFSLSVTMFNDENIAGLAVPLYYSKDYLVFDSISFVGSAVQNWGFRGGTHDVAEATILIGAVAIGDAPVLAGRRKLAELHFHVRSDISADVTTLIDSAFVPPAGSFELNTSIAAIIRPAFKAGKVTISTVNQPPVFDPIAARTVNEGELVNLTVRASDPERAATKLHAGRLCPGAKFADNGNGTGLLTWQVPYVGEGSATSGVVSIVVVASDGDINSSLEIKFNVVNRNRLPEITVGSNIVGGAGDTLYVPFAASDPDFEAVSFSASGLPTGAALSAGNPGYVVWASDIADSGDYSFTLNATDATGGVASRQVGFRLLPNMPIELAISEEQAFSGEHVTVSLNLHNRVAVSGYEVLIGYDRTLLTLISAVKTGTRIESWSQLNVSTTSDGKVILSAKSNASNPATNPLAIGNGEVAKITFQISSDLSFAGFHSTLTYATINPLSNNENIAYDVSGAVIPRAQTLYANGGILVQRYEGLIGDINLNGVPFEIGDVVYFTNYFMDPVRYPLTGPRLQNSDVNQDGTPATLADLIRLIQIFTGGGNKVNTPTNGNAISYKLSSANSEWSYTLSNRAEFAAALFVLEVQSDRDYQFLSTENLAAFEVSMHQDGEYLRVLLHEKNGRNASVDAGDLIRLDGEFAIVSQQFVDHVGDDVPVGLDRATTLPTSFELLQNYPNPFNPETSISFDIPRSGHVTLEIINILGATVATPINGTLAAGRHTVAFRGVTPEGSPLPSGIYFYRMRSEQFESTRKMVLLK